MGGYVAKQAFLPPPVTPITQVNDVTFITMPRSKHKIPVLHIKHPSNPEFTILFSHGNAEDVGVSEGWFYELSEKLKVNFVAFDYSGYGESKTKDGQQILQPSESYCFENVKAVYQHLTEDCKIPANKVIVMGRSLGSGPTVELASKNPVRAVILQSPLLSAVRVVMKSPFTLPFDLFANVDKIAKIKAPVFIIHGSVDQVVPQFHGKELYNQIPQKYAFEPYWISGAGHNDIEYRFHEEYLSKLRGFLGSLSKEEFPTKP